MICEQDCVVSMRPTTAGGMDQKHVSARLNAIAVEPNCTPGSTAGADACEQSTSAKSTM